MKTKIVTRHKGALEWIQKHHPEFGDAEVVEYARKKDLVGCRIVGVLPIPLAALCGEYWHLDMPVPPEARGKEISCRDMERFHCRIQEYLVRAVREK